MRDTRHDGGVRYVRRWPLVAVCAVVELVLVVLLARQGLDRADQWASVLGLVVVGIPGVLVAFVGLRGRSARDGGSPVETTATVTQSNRGGVNVANTGTMGDVTVRRHGEAP